MDICKLRNRYFILRHGESEVNVRRIIISDPKDGTTKFGLTEKGRQQVEDAVLKADILDKDTVIYSSDFKRARESAEIARKVLISKPVHLTVKLRERHFGNWERSDSSNYQVVWAEDAVNPDHKKNKIESANEVLNRTTLLVGQLEKKYSGEKILLVAHGDSLQILQTGFMKVDTSTHRNIKYLELGEIRELKLAQPS